MGKVCKNMCEDVEKQTLSCSPSVPITLTLFNSELIQKLVHVSGFQKISHFFHKCGHFQSYLYSHMGHFFGTHCSLHRVIFSANTNKQTKSNIVHIRTKQIFRVTKK